MLMEGGVTRALPGDVSTGAPEETARGGVSVADGGRCDKGPPKRGNNWGRRYEASGGGAGMSRDGYRRHGSAEARRRGVDVRERNRPTTHGDGNGGL